MSKKILYVDMDNVLVDFKSGIKRLSAEECAVYKGKYDDAPGIFALMDPMPGALEAFHQLAQLFDIYILSTSPWKNPLAWSDKLVWVKRYLGEDAKKRLILTHHKELNRGDFLIDDRRERGASEFEGELIAFDSKHPDWPAIVRYLKEKA